MNIPKSPRNNTLIPDVTRTTSRGNLSFFIGQKDDGFYKQNEEDEEEEETCFMPQSPESLSPPLPDTPRNDNEDEEDRSSLFDMEDNTWSMSPKIPPFPPLASLPPPPGLPPLPPLLRYNPFLNFFGPLASTSAQRRQPAISLLQRPLFAGIAASMKEDAALREKCDTITLQAPLLHDATFWRISICSFLQIVFENNLNLVEDFCRKNFDDAVARFKIWILRQTVTENIYSIVVYKRNDQTKQVFVTEFIDTHPVTDFASQRFSKQFPTLEICWPQKVETLC